jgi:hypothetical protein
MQKKLAMKVLAYILTTNKQSVCMCMQQSMQGKAVKEGCPNSEKRAANSKEDGCPRGSKPRPLGPWAKGEAVGTKPSQNVGKKGPKKTLGREPKWLGRGL